MATITVNTNLAEITGRLQSKLNKLRDKDYLLRPLCFDLIELMKKRIHEDGKNASGSQIGTYSNAYLRERQKKYNRSGDSKVVISLTRQMENDWSVIATQQGYGVGFKNPFNLQKAIWVQDGHSATTVKAHKRNGKDVKSHSRKGWAGYGRIFSLTAEEKKYASDFINLMTQQALSND